MSTENALTGRTRLHLGCGLRYDPEAVNVDMVPLEKVDVLHNLNEIPWPFPDNRFESVEMRDVLEHLDSTLTVLEEIHRVCKPGARVHIIVPHFSSNGAYTDLTHRRFFAALTFDYLTEGHPQAFYTTCRFSIENRQIVFRPTLLNKVVWRFANRYPQLYEERWAWMFPAWFISLDLIALKANHTLGTNHSSR
jgi:SAM-dependent methyltransferase